MEQRTASPQRFWIAATALIAAFLIVRILVAVFFWPSHPHSGELFEGVIAREFLNGPILPVFEYQTSPKCGGSVLLGGFIAIAFSIMGPSYAAVKLVGILLALIGTLLWTMLVAKIFGRRSALWYLGMGVVLPPVPLYCSLLVNGRWSFPDIIHALGLILLCGAIGERSAPAMRERSDRAVTAALFFLGALLGLGVFISYDFFFIISIYVIVVLVLYRTLNSVSKIGAFLSGILIGIIPRIASNLHYHYWQLGILNWGPPGSKAYFHTAPSRLEWLTQTSSNFVRQCVSLVLYWWPDFWTESLVTPAALRIVLSRMYELLFLSGIVLALFCTRRALNTPRPGKTFLLPPYPERARQRVRIVLGFFAFVIMATCFSRLGIARKHEGLFEYHYLMPLIPFCLLGLAVFFDRLTLCRLRSLRTCGWAIALVLISLLLVGNRSLLSRCDPDLFFGQIGYSYRSLGDNRAKTAYFEGNPNDPLVFAEKVRDSHDRDDLIGIIVDMYWFIPLHERYWQQTGKSAARGGGDLNAIDIGEVRKIGEEKIDAKYQPALYRALGRGFCWSHGSNVTEIAKLAGTLPAKSARWAWQGVGSTEAWGHGPDANWLLPALKDLPPEARQPFCEGVGAAWGLESRERGQDFDKLLLALPEDIRSACRSGKDMGFIRHPFMLLEL